MTVGLIVITHNQIGSTLMETASSMLGGCPMPLEIISVTTGSNPEQILQLARDKLDRLGQGDGVIVLTDMYGSTPSNIATRLCGDDDKVAVIAGINLPMLVRLLNYPNLSLEQLVEKAMSGGQDGILLYCNKG